MATATVTAKKKKRKRRPRKPTKATAAKHGVTDEMRQYVEGVPGYNPYRDAGECLFDAEAAQRAIDFFPACLKLVKGCQGRPPFELSHWEKCVVANLFGWKRPDGTRRYRRAFIYVAKKNGKTAFAAGLLLYVLVCDDEPGAEIYGAASSKDQAALVFSHAAGMVRAEPELASRLTVYGAKGGGVTKAIVSNADPGSSYRVISADADTGDGVNVHFAVIDETHRLGKRDFVDVIESSTAARRQPLVVHITTADYNRPSVCNDLHEYASNVRDGVVKDQKFLPVIYEASADDDWTSPKTWRKANPNLGVTMTQEDLADDCKKAQAQPSYLNTFKRLRLNIVTDSFEQWIPLEAWLACGPGKVTTAEATRAPLWERMVGNTAYVGLDLSSKVDLTCCAAVFPISDDEHERYASMTFFYAPHDRAIERAKRDKVDYLRWAEEGWLTFTPGDVIDYEWIRKDITTKLAKEFGVAEVAFDPWNAGPFALRLQEEDDVPVVEVRQGYASLSEPAKTFEALVTGGQWEHDGNPVMSWCVNNTVVVHDPADNIKPDKKHSTERIDGVAATITALARARLGGGDGSSYDADRGLMVIGE